MSRLDWRSSEQGVVSSLLQARDLLREGLRRPWRVLLVSLASSLALVSALALRDRVHAPQFVIRVSEADRDPSGMPHLKRRLADYVREGVLTSQPLLELMQRHGLYPSLMSKNPRAALESFREDISIEVYQNYFVEARAPGAVPRSARLTVSYGSKDPAKALEVTRELGRFIIAHERAVRREQAAVAASDADRARDSLRRTLETRAGQAVAMQTQIARAPEPDPELQVKLVGLLGSVSALEQELETVERRAASLELGAALERRDMGLYFEVVEEGALPSRAGRKQQLLLVFGCALLIALPLVAMTFAAFASERGFQ